ncbi:mucin-5AC-like isoform X2 [Paramacrobiotus metropolitanus]|uniref:mucin-5AC-like isoform X2 n=1 Tax=Paramacrobiotus metropolitanus TaxID=2943436 RepID=UPI002445822A|nr:mucin-5AC-like isoform X2 [Paramacrobiotus metropolitanus]
MSGLVIAVFLVMISAGGVLSQMPQLSCQCTSGILRGLQVCATDGKTYGTPCDLTNAQRTNSALGLKCLGPCPCPAAIPAVSKVCIRFGLWNSITGTSTAAPSTTSGASTVASTTSAAVVSTTTAAPTTSTTAVSTSTTVAQQSPGPIQPFAGALKPGRRHGGRSHGHHRPGHGGRSSSEERPGSSFRPVLVGPPVCLTNGTTLYDPVAVRCAVADPNTPTPRNPAPQPSPPRPWRPPRAAAPPSPSRTLPA